MTASDDRVHILAGKFFDGTGDRVREDVVVEVSDGIISDVVDLAQVRGRSIDIDLKRLMVLPGLIDSHVHLSFDHYKGSILAQQARPLIERAATAAPILEARLMGGITTVRIPGERDWLSKSMKQVVSQGM